MHKLIFLDSTKSRKYFEKLHGIQPCVEKICKKDASGKIGHSSKILSDSKTFIKTI